LHMCELVLHASLKSVATDGFSEIFEGIKNWPSSLNLVNRLTHTNFSTFHAIQIFTVIVKKLM
jgi:hypothetical protein